MQAAEAERRFAEATFESTLIRAPFTGTVLRKEAEVGEVVAEADDALGVHQADGAILRRMSVQDDLLEARLQAPR